MADNHAQGAITVTLTRQDFEDMVGRALKTIVREPYEHHIVVDLVNLTVPYDAGGWYIDYHLEKDEDKE